MNPNLEIRTLPGHISPDEIRIAVIEYVFCSSNVPNRQTGQSGVKKGWESDIQIPISPAIGTWSSSFAACPLVL